MPLDHELPTRAIMRTWHPATAAADLGPRSDGLTVQSWLRPLCEAGFGPFLMVMDREPAGQLDPYSRSAHARMSAATQSPVEQTR